MHYALLMAGIFVLIVPTPSAYAIDTPYSQNLTEGIEAFYHADWEHARTIFEREIENHPDQPYAYFFRSMPFFWSYFFGGESPEDASAFMEHSEQAITVAEDRLKSAPEEEHTILILSGLYGYRSLVAAGKGNYRTAMSNSISAHKYSGKLMDADSKNPNALIGRGMFEYMAGSIPGGLSWLTSLFGVSGDKETGFELLEQAAREDALVSADAKMILTYLYLEEGKPEQALPYIRELCKEYPENGIFHFYHARTLEADNQKEEAKKAYRQAISSNRPELPELKKQSRQRLEEMVAAVSNT